MTAESIPLSFFERVHETFRAAEQTAGSVERSFSIAGLHIRLRFAGPGMVPLLTPAIEHLAAATVPSPDLTVCLWDNQSTRTHLPTIPWAPEDYLARGEIRGFTTDRIHTALYPGIGMLNMLDAETKTALFCIRDVAQFPSYQRGSPLLTILHWFFGRSGLQLTHAAAVGHASGGVLLVGKGGSGKSTTALSCLDSALSYVSDDYCLLDVRDKPRAHCLFSSAKLNAAWIQRLPHLAPMIDHSVPLDSGKRLLFLHQHYPGKLVAQFPLRAVVVPCITGRPETTWAAAPQTAGLRALAPSTIFQLSGAGGREFDTMARLAKILPCYSLALGTDLPRIPEAIFSLLKELGS